MNVRALYFDHDDSSAKVHVAGGDVVEARPAEGSGAEGNATERTAAEGSAAGGSVTEGGIELLARFRASTTGVLWLDFHGEPTPEESRVLLETLAFDPGSVEEAHATRHPPKLEVFDDHVFFLLRGFNATAKSINFQIVHLPVFVAERLVVTRHREVSPSVATLWAEAKHDPATLFQSSGFLALRLGQAVAGRHLPIVLGVEDRLEQIEELIFKRSANDGLLNELLLYKRQLKKLRRNAGYEARIFARLQAEPNALFPAHLRREAEEAFGRFERLGSLANLYNELATDLTNGYLSVASHRLNKVMKVLTIITAIFVPLSFIAGVYGMNFDYMPEIHDPNGYYIVMGAMAVIGAALLGAFRLWRWI